MVSVDIPNTIKEIGTEAFMQCNSLKSIEIPSSVERIGDGAFRECTSLNSVKIPNSIKTIEKNTFDDCESLASIELPNSVKTIEGSAFGDCTSLVSIEIPNSVTNIEGSAFHDCTNLVSIELSNSLRTIARYTFSGCASLTSIELPNSVTTIDENAFRDCTGLVAIELPNSVRNIGDWAFAGCTNLKSVRIPSSVLNIDNYSYDVFNGCENLTEIILLCNLERYGFVREAPDGANIYAYSTGIEQIKSLYGEKNFNFHEIPIAISRKESFEEISFKNGTSVNGHKIEVTGAVAVEISDIYPDETGTYTYKFSNANEQVTIIVYFTFDGKNELYSFVAQSKPELSFDYEPHQTYAVFNVRVSSGERIQPSEFGVANYMSHHYPVASDDIEIGDGVKNGSVKVGFDKDDSYGWKPYAVYNGVYCYGEKKSVYLKEIDPTFQYNTITPTTIKCVGQQTIEDATLEREYFTVGSKEYEGSDITITGLKPNTSYDIAYHVVTEERGDERSERLEFRTQELDLSILRPKCVSSTCAIVAAETNISEDEPNVGFQWRKYDAPETLPSNEGYAAIYDGRLEGYVKNLQPTSYYNVRAFYKAEDDTYYYSDWITFDPSDFSYFEPTVHTYPIDEVTDSRAKVRGYALAGTDEITEQGFEYWALGGDPSKAMRVKAAPGDGGDVSVVIATGQVMTAELTNLAPNTTYCCRAFVTTTGGTTYGEEQAFTTMAGPTGIYSAETEKAEPTIMGYYDLGGRKLNGPAHGAVTIVRYSDGSARKVLIK